jgi:dipeptidyl aminopeptidase/acylaminoacyl peptidase
VRNRRAKLGCDAALTVALGIVLGCAPGPSIQPSSSSRVSGSPPSAGPSAATASAGPSTLVVRPGEPWIVYQGGTVSHGPTQLRLVRPDGSDDHPVMAEDGPADQAHPAWSPDGERIAFESWVGQPTGPARIELWVVDVAGRNRRRLAVCAKPCHQLAYPSWSPDGRSIAVIAYDLHSDLTWGPSHVDIVDAESGGRTRISSSSDGLTAFYTPRWSPDGRSLVLVVQTYPDARQGATRTSRLATLPVTSGGAPSFLTHPSLLAQEPDWAPSSRIVFSTAPTMAAWSTSARLASIDPDVDSTDALVDRPGATTIDPTWQSDGSLQFVIASPGSDERVALLPPRGAPVVVASWALRTPVGGVQQTHAHRRPVP